MQWIALMIALALALIHVFAQQLHMIRYIPRSRWLSLAGGASVAYVFLHLLPELSAGQAVLAESTAEPLRFFEHHVYILALLSLVVFYGLERLAKRSREQQAAASSADRAEAATSPGVFWIHIISFGMYNLLIGYLLLHREQSTTQSLLLFGLAMGLHFLVNDFGLHEHHKSMYSRIGRWLLALAVLLGWSVGALTELSKTAIAVLLALLAGGVILNVLKEELPEERASRFSAFLIGAVLYTVLLLTV